MVVLRSHLAQALSSLPAHHRYTKMSVRGRQTRPCFPAPADVGTGDMSTYAMWQGFSLPLLQGATPAEGPVRGASDPYIQSLLRQPWGEELPSNLRVGIAQCISQQVRPWVTTVRCCLTELDKWAQELDRKFVGWVRNSFTALQSLSSSDAVHRASLTEMDEHLANFESLLESVRRGSATLAGQVGALHAEVSSLRDEARIFRARERSGSHPRSRPAPEPPVVSSDPPATYPPSATESAFASVRVGEQLLLSLGGAPAPRNRDHSVASQVSEDSSAPCPVRIQAAQVLARIRRADEGREPSPVFRGGASRSCIPGACEPR